MSALCVSSSRSAPSSGKIASPSDAGARSASASPMRLALARACSASISGNSTANSSPPSRPTESAGRTTRSSVWETQHSSSSPAACPKMSLTGLKWSMSSTRIAPERRSRVIAPISATARSSKPRRFRQPVSGSVRDTVASARCWRLWFWPARRSSQPCRPARARTRPRRRCSTRPRQREGEIAEDADDADRRRPTRGGRTSRRRRQGRRRRARAGSTCRRRRAYPRSASRSPSGSSSGRTARASGCGRSARAAAGPRATRRRQTSRTGSPARGGSRATT